MFYHRFLANYAVPELERRAGAFLSGYRAGRPGFETDELRAELPAILGRWEATQLELRGRLRVLVYRPSLARLRRFVSGLE